MTESLEENSNSNDILVIGEDAPSVCTYSLSRLISLTNKSRQYQPCSDFRGFDNLLVPYSTINIIKQARIDGAREALFIAVERPDRSPEVRTTLDLWGFSSYINYLYTVTELAFLEGLIPVIDVGFLTPTELQKMTEICALFKILLNQPSVLGETLSPLAAEKQHAIRIKSIEWAGKLDMPVISGLYVGNKETKAQRKEWLSEIANLHHTYGHIHEVTIFPLIQQSPSKKISGSLEKTLLDTFLLAKSILPEDVTVNVPAYLIEHIQPFFESGLLDLGTILLGNNFLTIPNQTPFEFNTLKSKVEDAGLSLQQRFPLKKAYIQKSRYSNKLGQVFDAYKYKIKKHEQQLVKDKAQAQSASPTHI